jgi:hypothetical protein
MAMEQAGKDRTKRRPYPLEGTEHNEAVTTTNFDKNHSWL